jgi:hypothetical protein
MDGSIRAVRPYSNRSEKGGVAFVGLNPRPITLGVEVSVMILYADAAISEDQAARSTDRSWPTAEVSRTGAIDPKWSVALPLVRAFLEPQDTRGSGIWES